MIRILHISDLHYSDKNSNDQSIVISALQEDLQRLCNDGMRPDFVVFSGDLVQSGDIREQFQGAKENFIKPVLTTCELDVDRFFIVPGNHDIQRKVVETDSYVEKGLRESLSSTEELNRFVDGLAKNDAAALLAFRRLENYEAEIGSLNSNNIVRSNNLYRSYRFGVDGTDVGIVCFNTAWRACGTGGQTEYGNLLIGERTVDDATKDVLNCDLRIAIQHHPLTWLREYDTVNVEARVFQSFDLLLSGHVHRAQPEFRETHIGKCVLGQCGSLYQTRDYFNGYTLIEIDRDYRKANFLVRSYFDNPRRSFDAATNVISGGGISFDMAKSKVGKNEADVLEVLREIRPKIRELANQHLRMSNAEDGSFNIDIHENFVVPPISERPEVGLRSADVADNNFKGVDYKELLTSSDCTIVNGRAESGKTILAWYLAVRASEGLTDRPRIPVMVNFNSIRPGQDPFGRAARGFLNEVESEIKFNEFKGRGKFLFLVDDVKLSDKKTLKLLSQYISENRKDRWILFANEDSFLFSHKDTLQEFFPNSRLLYIHTLPRKSIRELTRRWFQDSEQDHERVFNTVMGHVNSSGLPRSGYIVSLLLWSIQRKRNFEAINEAVLLENIVEYLLEKADFTRALRREFDYKSKEILLQALAVFLRSCGGAAAHNEVLDFIIKFLADKGLEYNAAEVLLKFVECGLLHDDDVIAFKYPRFQDYFFAGEMRDNPDLLNKVIGESEYTEYLREIDLYTARYRREIDVTDTILSHLHSDVPSIVSDADVNSFPPSGTNQPLVEQSYRRMEEILEKELDSDEVDDLLDRAEKKVISRQIGNGTNRKKNGDGPPLGQMQKFLATLDVLGRSIRNGEFLDVNDKNRLVDEFFQTWGRVIVSLLNTLEVSLEEVRKEKIDGEWRKNTDVKESTIRNAEKFTDVIEYFAKVHVPVILSNLMYNEIGTEKLIPILNNVVSDVEVSLSKRIIAAFVLLDLDMDDGVRHLRDICEDHENERYILQLVTEKLYMYYRTRPLTKTKRKSLENLIGDIGLRLGGGQSQKARLIAQLKKSAYRE